MHGFRALHAVAIVPDRLNGADIQRFQAERFLLGSGWLLADMIIALRCLAAEVFRRGGDAQVAIYAIAVDIENAGDIFWIFCWDFAHWVKRYGFWFVTKLELRPLIPHAMKPGDV